MVHGEAWTVKELFVLPNEYVYWSIQIVLYPYMTGLVAGAFVLSSLYHVFGVEKLKEIARFALVFSFALLPVAMMPLLLHLQQPFRGIHVMMTPHFTSAISAFGIVFMTYACIVGSEIWFVYRQFIVESINRLEKKERRGIENMLLPIYKVVSLGARDLSPEALKADHKAVKFLAGLGIPVACFLHGYAGFIFGSVKANALWMTPLMPVIFIMSAVVSGIALCILCYAIFMGLRRWALPRGKTHFLPDHWAGATELTPEGLHSMQDYETKMTSKYLLIFMTLAITLELLDIIFRGYTAVRSWDIVREVIYQRDFFKIFVLQYGFGNALPFIMLLLPGLTTRRACVACVLVLFGVLMMRWNVVIGGQAFSLTFDGFMEYHLPIIPYDMETFKEGLGGALLVAVTPFVIFYFINMIFPAFITDDKAH
ncbi:oxidoreductase [Geothermobacter hydrogeniphilus]|uniref:Oxidoreductase n=1 Tax=Geothermobacter hydrogeniphilus TaxID=1969733 RepID=A0A2K2H8G7_9BACT|nr:NrfD/PsrC family molybdoenzyme membrane anchor subunit [Geothermobacter hydrogeniphilus]PNU19616.1 oxidoreductase [Geothermobacter hydrogeniphilus]